MTATVLGVCGNPRPGSRTLGVVSAAVSALVGALAASDSGTLDLVELRADLFNFGAPSIENARQRIAAADVLVVGTPVYKASYSGVLKAFCDHVSAGEWSGKFAVPLMVGGSLQHYLALDTHLRPLLVELGATCATPGLYVVETELDGLEEQLREYVATIKRPFVDSVLDGH